MTDQLTPEQRRQKLRAKTVGKKPDFPTRIVEVDGDEYEVRALTYKEAQKVSDGLTEIIPPDGMTTAQAIKAEEFEIDVDQKEYINRLLLRCVFVPDTDVRVFEEGDRETFDEQPAHDDHWLARLIEAATELNRSGNSVQTSDG